MKNAKKLLGLVLVMVLLATLTVAVGAADAGNTQPVSTNLITNGDFETANPYGETEIKWADGWKPNGTGAYGRSEVGTDVSVTTEKVHTGTSALKVVTSSADGRWISQEITGLTPGKAYRASAWVHIDGTLAAENGAEIRIAESNDSGASKYLVTSSTNGSKKSLTTTNSTWRQIDCAIVLEATEEYTAQSVHVVLYANKTDEVTIYWDDVTFTEIKDINGGFEKTVTETVSGLETCTWAEGWSAVNVVVTGTSNVFDTFLSENTRLTKDVVHSGEYALQLTNPETSRNKGQRVYIPVTGLTKGEWYKASAWVKKETGSPQLMVADAVSSVGSGSSGFRVYKTAGTSNDWQELVVYFEAQASYAYVVLNSGTISSNDAVYYDDVTVSSTKAEFFNSKGAELNKTETGEITVKAWFANTSGAAITGTLLVAVYEFIGENKRLVSVELKESGSVEDGEAGTASATVTASADNVIKAMFFNGLSELVPLTEATELSAGA